MFTTAELQATRRNLLALLRRLNSERAGLTGEAFGAAEGVRGVPHRADEQSGVHLEDEVTLGLLANEERLVAQIDAALLRLNAGTYGHCEDCGRPISMRRLRAIPYAARCIACARLTQLAVDG